MRVDPREELRRLYQFCCGYCGTREVDAGAALTIDHLQPRSHGGSDDLANWVYCCHACNEFKGDYWCPDTPHRILHPLHDDRSIHLVEDTDGKLRGLTLCYKLQRLLGFHNPRWHEPPTHVLFIELAEMGSTVLAYPAMQALKARYPQAQLYFVIFKHLKESLDICDLIPTENVFVIDSTSLWSLGRDALTFALASRRKKIDTVIVLEMFARYSAILSYVSGARKRVGFYRYQQEGLYIGDFSRIKCTTTRISTPPTRLSPWCRLSRRRAGRFR